MRSGFMAEDLGTERNSHKPVGIQKLSVPGTLSLHIKLPKARCRS